MKNKIIKSFDQMHFFSFILLFNKVLNFDGEENESVLLIRFKFKRKNYSIY